MTTIGFLHTATAHVPTFERLVAEIAPGARSMSVVREHLLERAIRVGPDDPGVVDGLREAIAALGACDVVVCTCSTIGDAAEVVGAETGARVVRVDRPMAEEAARLAAAGAGRIVVVAAVSSTLAPTAALLASIIDRSGADVSVDMRLVDGAWQRFEAGDRAGYIDTIAGALPGFAAGADVVVLAQASMADAAESVDLDVPVLSSPRLAVASALG